MTDATQGTPLGFEGPPPPFVTGPPPPPEGDYSLYGEPPVPAPRRNLSSGVVVAEFVTVLLHLISILAAYSAVDFDAMGTTFRDNSRVAIALIGVATVLALAAVALLTTRTPVSAALTVLSGAVASTSLLWSVIRNWSEFQHVADLATNFALFAQASIPLVLGLVALGLWRPEVT